MAACLCCDGTESLFVSHTQSQRPKEMPRIRIGLHERMLEMLNPTKMFVHAYKLLHVIIDFAIAVYASTFQFVLPTPDLFKTYAAMISSSIA